MSGPDFFGFEPLVELEGGYCSRVWADETRVLKVPWRGEEMTTGRLAAERMSPWPGVRVLDSDVDSGALLMERLGRSLAEEWDPARDDEATDVFLSLAPALRGLETSGLMPLENYVSKKDDLAQELLKSTEERCFLHGDLHHHNILRKDNDWRIIDPKGLVGDPAWEAAAFVLNPLGLDHFEGDLAALFRNRLTRLSAGMDLPEYRIWAWTLVLVRDTDDGGWPKGVQAVEAIRP